MNDSDSKPIEDWDMNFPQQILTLRNKYERGHMSLCGLFQILSDKQGCPNTHIFKVK